MKPHHEVIQDLRVDRFALDCLELFSTTVIQFNQVQFMLNQNQIQEILKARLKALLIESLVVS